MTQAFNITTLPITGLLASVVPELLMLDPSVQQTDGDC